MSSITRPTAINNFRSLRIQFSLKPFRSQSFSTSATHSRSRSRSARRTDEAIAANIRGNFIGWAKCLDVVILPVHFNHLPPEVLAALAGKVPVQIGRYPAEHIHTSSLFDPDTASHNAGGELGQDGNAPATLVTSPWGTTIMVQDTTMKHKDMENEVHSTHQASAGAIRYRKVRLQHGEYVMIRRRNSSIALDRGQQYVNKYENVRDRLSVSRIEHLQSLFSDAPKEWGSVAPVDLVEALKIVEGIIDYTFDNQCLLWNALLSIKSGPEIPVPGSKGKKRHLDNMDLAFVGDTWMKSILLDFWDPQTMRRGGTISSMDFLVSNKNLAKICEKNGIHQYINIASRTSYLYNKPVSTEKIYADTIEAILGAVKIDGGYTAAQHVMQNLGLILPNGRTFSYVRADYEADPTDSAIAAETSRQIDAGDDKML